MSYAATGSAMGASEGYASPFNCEDYIVRSDGRCADTGGVHALAWYDIHLGQCVDPPPISCDVNAQSLPQSCPSGMMLNSAVPSGCSPAGKSSPPTTGGSSPPAFLPALPSQTQPKVKKASFLDTMKDNQIATAAVFGGLLLIAASFANPDK